jgi:hypothetical protein
LITAATFTVVGIPFSECRAACAAVTLLFMDFVAPCSRAVSGDTADAVDAVPAGGLSEWWSRTTTTITTTKTTKRLASTAAVMKARLRRLCCRCASPTECTGRGGRVAELACSRGASGHGADTDARSQFGIGGGKASSGGSGRTAAFGVTIGSGAHTGFGGIAVAGVCARVADAGFLAGRRLGGAGGAGGAGDAGDAASDCTALGWGDRVAGIDFSAGRRAVSAGLAPSVSGAGALLALRLVRVGSEALSSLSGVVVSAVGMPQYGVRHTRWKVPRPIALEGVRRQESEGPVRGC